MEPSEAEAATPPYWRFNSLVRWMNKSDPVESEFFTGEGQPDALIRETVQNSLDASNGDTVRLRFAFIAPDSSRVAPFLKNLHPHLEAQEFVDEVPAGAVTQCLVIEDSGTRGLVGDPRQDQDSSDAGPKNDFYYFYRNTGRSRKSESDLGRWGLGKRVLTTSSRIFSFLGLTRREDDRRLLMGLSVLKVHMLDEEERYPYGYFGNFEEDGFSLPVEEPETLDTVEEVFGLNRAEPGLSIVIPWPKEELTAEELVRSVVHHYFYPIIRGRLVVTIEDLDGLATIDDESLEDIVERAEWGDEAERQHLLRLVGFARKAQRHHDSHSLIELRTVGEEYAPSWSADLFEDLDLPALRERFAAGEMISLLAPIVVRRKGSEPVTSTIEIFLERDDSLSGGERTYVRQGITISEVRGRPKPGVRALIVAEDDHIAELLGDSENPAHTEWRERSERVKRGFDNGAFTVRFVIKAPNFCIDQLTATAAGRDRDLLRDIFFVPEPPEPTPPDEPGEEDDETSPTPVVEVTSRPARFRITRLEGGFAVTGTEALATPAEMKIRMAYEVRRGNPFKKYSPLDFSVAEAPVTVGVRDCDLLVREGNHLLVRLQEPEFRLEVRGFDQNRDLRIHADVTEVS